MFFRVNDLAVLIGWMGKAFGVVQFPLETINTIILIDINSKRRPNNLERNSSLLVGGALNFSSVTPHARYKFSFDPLHGVLTSEFKSRFEITNHLMKRIRVLGLIIEIDPMLKNSSATTPAKIIDSMICFPLMSVVAI